MSDFVDAFTFLHDNSDLILGKLGTHMELSAESMAIALVIGLPLGLWLGHLRRFSFVAISISNVERALPSLAILFILLVLIGLGDAEVIITLVILAFPPILTNTYVAIEQVDADTVDAARGMGLTAWQVLYRIELPQALPLIFAGIRTSAVFVVATATLGGIFGGGGLGEIINDRESYGLPGIIATAYVLIVLNFIVQLVFLGLERALTPAGLRRERRRIRRGAPTPLVHDDLADVTGGDVPVERA